MKLGDNTLNNERFSLVTTKQFQVLRYTAASKIVNNVISLLWQFWCHCNPDLNKFSSLSNTTVMAVFPNLCLLRRSLCSNLGGIDPEKLYRATLMRLYLFHMCSVYFLWSILPVEATDLLLKFLGADVAMNLFIGRGRQVNTPKMWQSSHQSIKN